MAASLHQGLIASPLGALLAVAGDEGIVLLEFAEPGRLGLQLAALRRHYPQAPRETPHPLLAELAQALEAYFAGALRDFRLPLQAPGSPFQRRVWDALQRIPYGETLSYQALAETVAGPRASRAVGTANGQNRLAILIPCHRVVNKSGALGGYGGGLWRKQRLLDLESRRRPLLAG